MSVPTVDDLKAHLNVTRDDNDDELADMLDAALDVVTGIIGPVGATPVTEVHYAASSALLVLRQMPVSSVESIAYSYFGGSPTTIASSSYVLDAATGLVRMVTGFAFRGDVTVTYTAGSEVVPAAVRLATLEIAGHLWETQRGTSPSAVAVQQQDIADPSFAPGLGYAIPSRARELLAPYVRPSIA